MYKDFTYHVFGPNSAFYPEETELRNRVFYAWFRLWSEVYNESESGYELHSEEFSRQQIVTAVMHRNEIAGIHLYSFFSLNSVPDLKTKYFHFFSENYLANLRRHQVKTVMSMEFLTVMPEFRKSKVGVSLGSVLIQLGTQVFRKTQAGAIVAPARNDVGVNRMSYDAGFSCIEKDTLQRGFVCDLVACFQGNQKASENEEIQTCAEYLWEKRMVYPSAMNLIEVENTHSIPRAA